MRRFPPAIFTVLFLGLILPPAFSQSGEIALDLNALETTGSGCRTTFVGENRLGTELEKIAFEIVLFNQDGLVMRMLGLDFGAMAEGRTKVAQFTLPDTQCDSIGRVLINDIQACDGPADQAVCLQSLVTESRSGITFGL